MTTFASLDTCIGRYHLDATGFDAVGDRLVDLSGYGNHLAISGATDPTYRTVGGFQCIEFTNTYWFEGDSNLPPEFSWLFVGAADYAAADGTLRIVNTADRNFNTADDRDGNPAAISDADWHSTVYKQKAIELVIMTPRIYDDIGVAQSGAAWSTNTMDLHLGAVRGLPAQLLAAGKTGVASASNFLAGVQTASNPRTGSRMRVGHLKSAAGALASSKWVAGKRLFIFEGVVFDHAGFAAALAAEKTAFGIV